MRPAVLKINHIRKVRYCIVLEAAVKKIRVCIDAWGRGALEGRTYNMALRQGVQFSDVNQLCSSLENVFEKIKYPAASTQFRVFGKKSWGNAAKKETEQTMNQDKITDTNPTGKKATFIVQVMYRQNATWQGQVIWSEKNETRQFRSALELIKLIDSAAEESNL